MEHIGENGIRAVQEAGLAWAVTTIRGVNTPETSPYLLQRIPIGTNRHWLALATDVAGLYPAFKREQGTLRRLVGLWRRPSQPSQPSHRSPSGSQHDQNVGPMPTVQVDQRHHQHQDHHSIPAHVGARHGLGTTTERRDAVTDGSDGLMEVIHGLARTSLIYAVAAMASPLVTLVLSPFLAHNLSRTDYGALAILTTIIALTAGVTQLGLGSAFFRAYNYDYQSERDRLKIVSTVVVLLAVVTLPTTITGMILAPRLAYLLLGSTSYSSAVKLAALVVLVQNLSVPGFAWLRAESRAAIYSALAILNLIIVLAGTIVLVGILQDGLAGALMAIVAGYASIVVLTLPVALIRTGLHVRYDIAWNLLTFGAPMLVNIITIWVLQLSDRFLLAHFGSLTQTASYDVAYKLGGVLSPVILAPFQLAWPIALFAIAQRDDARLMFQRMFRWYSSFLLLATYILSLTGIALLHLLFPPTYQSASAIIPIIGLSLMFYGLSMVVGIGIPIQRKMWLGAMYVGLSALVNVGLNIVWIPRYGAMAAAWSTLIAYFVLVASDYIVNQRIYPVHFEIGRFAVALLVGVAVFSSCTVLTELRSGIWGWATQGLGIVVYSVWLFLWTGGYHALRTYGPRALRANGAGSVRQLANGQTRAIHAQSGEHVSSEAGVPARICMHVLGTARTDVRVMREARTLARTGLTVSIIDVEQKRGVPREEVIDGVTVKHIVMPAWFLPTRFKPWFLIKAIQMLIRGALDLWRTPADLYHAHDFNALPACYLAARLRGKPLIFDAHELPLVDPNVTHWQLLCAMYVRLLRAIVPRCAGLITVSPPIASELAHRYGGPAPIVVRNIPPYRASTQHDHLRQSLDLGPQIRIALYQGSLQDDRGLDMLIRAAKFLEPNIVIVLMGHGPRQPALQRLIAHEDVGSAVRIIPPVAYDELLNWTGSADIGLIVNPASYSRNVELCLPNKLFEYLMAGAPVLSSRLTAVEAIIADYGVGRIVDPLEPEPVAGAISALLADRDGLERMRRNAVIATQRDLKWEVEQERLIDLYYQILNTRPKSVLPAEQTAKPLQSDIRG
jgi:O-antigen/teichoic acid export membrane protein/glycosyltransferase involved in cell wall biosynthesis